MLKMQKKKAEISGIKKYYIQTFGCQANVRDSQAMAGTLEALGFIETKNYKVADVLIINTCSVRQKSEDKVYGWGLKLGESKTNRGEFYDKKGDQVIFVTGCMIGSAKGDRKRIQLDAIKDRLVWADFLLAPDEEWQIPQILVLKIVLVMKIMKLLYNIVN
jgi:tRNA-2-methylthio-N6-dimethylallyladenosine synthase